MRKEKNSEITFDEPAILEIFLQKTKMGVTVWWFGGGREMEKTRLYRRRYRTVLVIF